MPNLADLTGCNTAVAASVVVAQLAYLVVSMAPLSLVAVAALLDSVLQAAHRVVLVLAAASAERAARRLAQHVVQVALAVSQAVYTRVPLALVVQAAQVVVYIQEAVPAVEYRQVEASVAAAVQVAYKMEPVVHRQAVSAVAVEQAVCSKGLAVHT